MNKDIGCFDVKFTFSEPEREPYHSFNIELEGDAGIQSILTGFEYNVAEPDLHVLHRGRRLRAHADAVSHYFAAADLRAVAVADGAADVGALVDPVARADAAPLAGADARAVANAVDAAVARAAASPTSAPSPAPSPAPSQLPRAPRHAYTVDAAVAGADGPHGRAGAGAVAAALARADPGPDAPAVAAAVAAALAPALALPVRGLPPDEPAERLDLEPVAAVGRGLGRRRHGALRW